MVGRQHQRFGAGEFRWFDDETVLAPFDPDAEWAKRGDRGRNAVGILVLEFLRIADDGRALGPRSERRQHRKLVDHALDQIRAADLDAAKLVTGLDDDPANRFIALPFWSARSRCPRPSPAECERSPSGSR